MFQTHFSFLFIVSINNIESFIYLISINNNKTMSKREITRAAHKAILDKTSKINNVTNRALRQLVCVVSKQMQSLFNRCIQKEVQPSYFKKTTTIMLRKSSKKDYFEPLSFRPIALLDTLDRHIVELFLVFDTISFLQRGPSRTV